jgi:hypothetical protein
MGIAIQTAPTMMAALREKCSYALLQRIDRKIEKAYYKHVTD